ncbi:NAD(P) transhydrogenase alpha subunit [Candidatus Burkholderia pumila]|uniref:proton-translocating NAD(P)(+) transhydrogenase n=1 Tax=Candidatus Burkholderia pumila TaxID=1090375 RepID=A0ABR5HKF4_9BURK|nr:NAD(P) transhydrogenase alpha subunit [Candidatus Burkholderia pumila]
MPKPGAVLIGILDPLNTENTPRLASANVTAFALEAALRTTRAQSLDVPFETDEEREAAESVGGYARPMPPPPNWLARQSAQVHERAKAMDIVISTALIPGSPAPTLLLVETVKHMKPGSVIVDLAAGRGLEYEGRKSGNCPLIEVDRVVVKQKHGVHIVGHTNLASMVAADASAFPVRTQPARLPEADSDERRRYAQYRSRG